MNCWAWVRFSPVTSLGSRADQQLHLLQHLHGRGAIGGRLGIGDGQMLKSAAREDSALVVNIALPGRPEDQPADGIGVAAVGEGVALRDQPGRGLGIGGQ
jgi:hypothetical protein